MLKNRLSRFIDKVKNRNKAGISDENSYEYCPRCDANLTLQKGYHNDLPFWVCKGCE